MGHDILTCKDCGEQHRTEWTDEREQLFQEGCTTCGSTNLQEEE